MNNNTVITFTSDEEFYRHINDSLDFKQALIVKGAPGTGKSQKCRSCINKRGAKLLVHATQALTPSHIKGLLFVNRDENTLEPFFHSLSDVIFNATEETVLYFEDMLLGDEALIKQFMSIIELRQVEGRPISEHVKFVFDTNDNSHGAGRGMVSTAVNSRATIVEAPIDVNGWLRWAVESGRIAKEIILFVHANPQFAYVSDLPKGRFENFNCFRTWENLTPFVRRGRKHFGVIHSCIGNTDSVAAEFLQFWNSLDTYGNLIAKVKADPDTAPMFEANEAEKILGSVFILSNHLEKTNVPKFVRYINRYSNNEYTSLLLSLGVQSHPDAKETTEYVQHVTKG